MKKKTVSFIAMLLVIVMGLCACGQSAPAATDESSSQASAEATNTADTSDLEIECFVGTNWGGILPPAGEDPVENYIEETFGGDWSLTLPTDEAAELSTRIAGGDTPELIHFRGVETGLNTLNTFYEQGAFIDDWNVWADKMPTAMANMTEEQIAMLSTPDGKLKAIGTIPGDQNFAFLIRQDWLDNLGLAMPTTVEELVEVMRAFTYDDPDGNGVDDTYGFTAAGQGTVGELGHLLFLFSSKTFYIDDNGEVNHPIISGNYKKYLDLAKEIVAGGYINPDWYTVSWSDRGSLLGEGIYGIMWYPPEALLSETKTILDAGGVTDDNTLADCWAVMDLCGGKGKPYPLMGDSLRTVSAETAEDPAKMEIICNFLEKTSGYMSEYNNIRMWDCFSDYSTVTEITPGSQYYWYADAISGAENGDEFMQTYSDYPGILNWGRMCNISSGLVSGTTEQPSHWTEQGMKLGAEVQAMEHWSNEGSLYVPDSTLATPCNDLEAQFAISYIMGETTDYDGFVNDWLALGGQQMLEEATDTLTTMGYIK